VAQADGRVSVGTSIEWTDATWNPVRGCSRISEGCRNCYAERIAARMSDPGMWGNGFAERTKAGPRWTGRVELVPAKLGDPLGWKHPRRVFVNSTSDLFHEALSDDAIAAVFGVMAAAPRHTFQILTKRPERMRAWFDAIDSKAVAMGGLRADRLWQLRAACTRYLAVGNWPSDVHAGGMDWPLPNVHLGVSVEDQATADSRIPFLLRTPADVRWVSYEPALGPVNFRRVLMPSGMPIDALNGRWAVPQNNGSPAGPTDTMHLDWIVVGGESGPGARPFDLAWARSTVEQCRAAGVPVFVKQLGGKPELRGDAIMDAIPMACGHTIENRVARLHLKDRKGGDWSEWPEDLRVREFPR
jgi:protein gp37